MTRSALLTATAFFLASTQLVVGQEPSSQDVTGVGILAGEVRHEETRLLRDKIVDLFGQAKSIDLEQLKSIIDEQRYSMRFADGICTLVDKRIDVLARRTERTPLIRALIDSVGEDGTFEYDALSDSERAAIMGFMHQSFPADRPSMSGTLMRAGLMMDLSLTLPNGQVVAERSMQSIGKELDGRMRDQSATMPEREPGERPPTTAEPMSDHLDTFYTGYPA